MKTECLQSKSIKASFGDGEGKDRAPLIKILINPRV